MANTVLGSTDADLAGKFLSVDGIKYVTGSLTNAQIIAASNNTPFQLVASVASRILVPIWAVLHSNFSAGAYTNVQTDDTGYMAISTNGVNGIAMGYVRNILHETITDFRDSFNNTTKRVIQFDKYQKLSASLGVGLQNVETLANVQGNIVLDIHNGALGAFTGGNAANTLKYALAYAQLVE